MQRNAALGQILGWALLGLALTVCAPALANNVKAPVSDVKFGDKPSFQSTDNFQYVLGEQKQSFTISFNPALETTVGPANLPVGTKADAPIGTQVWNVVIPVTGKNLRVTFTVTLSVLTEPGAGGAVVLRVNDRHAVARFGPTLEQKEILVELVYRAKSATDLRMTLFLLADRDAAHADASGLVQVTSIDADAVITKPARRGKKK